MYLKKVNVFKKICVAGYTTYYYGVMMVITLLETFKYKTNVIITIIPQQQVCQPTTQNFF